MRVLSVHASCPPELVDAVAQCSSLSECLEVQRPLAYHAECLVTLQSFKAQGLKVAVKSYSKHRLGRLAREQVDTEAHIHASLDSEHIMPLLLVAEDDASLHLVVRWADGGDLRQHLAAAPLGEQRLREFVVRPLLHALAVLDAKGVVHRDVKPDNVLVHQGQVQLADFGLAVYCHPRDKPASCEDDEAAGASAPSAASTAQCDGEAAHHTARPPASAAAAITSRDSSLPVSNHSSCSTLDTLALADVAVADAAEPPAEALAAQHLQHHHSMPDPPARLSLPHAATAPALMPMARAVSSQHTAAAAVVAGRLARPSSGGPLTSASSLPSSLELMSSAGGTPLYTAPEVLKCMFESRAVDQVVTPKNDVWSLGIMALEAVSGVHPFSRSSNALHAIASHKAFASLPAHLSAAATSWLTAALNPDPALRPSAAQLLAHPWMCQPTAAAAQQQQGDHAAMQQQQRQQHHDSAPYVASGSGAAAGSAGGAAGGVVARGCKVQMQRDAGSLGGVSPTAASAAIFMQAESWEY